MRFESTNHPIIAQNIGRPLNFDAISIGQLFHRCRGNIVYKYINRFLDPPGQFINIFLFGQINFKEINAASGCSLLNCTFKFCQFSAIAPQQDGFEIGWGQCACYFFTYSAISSGYYCCLHCLWLPFRFCLYHDDTKSTPSKQQHQSTLFYNITWPKSWNQYVQGFNLRPILSQAFPTQPTPNRI